MSLINFKKTNVKHRRKCSKIQCLKIKIPNFRFSKSLFYSRFPQTPALLTHLPTFCPIALACSKPCSQSVTSCSSTCSLCGQIFTFANNPYITIITYIKFDSYEAMMNSQIKLYINYI